MGTKTALSPARVMTGAVLSEDPCPEAATPTNSKLYIERLLSRLFVSSTAPSRMSSLHAEQRDRMSCTCSSVSDMTKVTPSSLRATAFDRLTSLR